MRNLSSSVAPPDTCRRAATSLHSVECRAPGKRIGL